MKKGDTVLVSDGGCGWIEAIFHHEYDGKFYVQNGGCNYLRGYSRCKPVKQSVDEFTREWVGAFNVVNIRVGITDLEHWFDKYYEDRKAWEESQI